VWIGTFDAGLNRLRPGETQFDRYLHDENDPSGISGDRITSLAEDSLGDMWIATNAGLQRVTEGEAPTFANIYQFESEQRSTVIFFDSTGNLWFGNREGLKQIPVTDLGKPDPLVANYTYEDDTENGDNGGLNVRSVAEDNQGHLWIGSGDGLRKFDPQTGEFIGVYDVQEPLPKGVGTHGLVTDKQGNLWAGADTIYQFDPQTESFTQYTESDGVMSGLVNYAYAGPSGRIYFGGNDGLNAFNPQDISFHDFVPPIVLTDFLLNNESVAIGGDGVLPDHVSSAEEIVLEHDDDIFSFDFSALNFREPGLNQYAYYLEGFDDDWIFTDANNRRATYTNIPPGDYSFHVKGSNNEGVWNEESVSVNIVITPPWWQTWWFRGAVLLLAVGLLYAGFRWRVSSVEKQKQQLEQEVVDRTLELTEINRQLQMAKEEAEETAVLEERQRLARDLHDAITQSLYGVMLFARASRDAQEAGDESKLEENLVEIETNSLQTLKEMRLLLHQLRPLSLEQGGFPEAINRRFDQVERRLGITATAEIKENLSLSRRTEESLFMITTEALNNSLKHGNAREVRACLDQSNGDIQLIIVVIGQGFDQSRPTAGMGLKNMQERADLLGADFEIRTEAGKGTRVQLSLPHAIKRE
jgi:signal transduction histidine kinase